MSKVKIMVKGGGRHEFSCKRLERMLRGACLRMNFGLKDEEVVVLAEGPIALNGASGPLKLKIEMSSDILGKIAPNKNDAQLLKFIQVMGETARRLGPENGWPERHVQVMELSTQASWSG